jgi:hypothetical protein
MLSRIKLPFMSWSREEALTDPAVREAMMFTSEFRFRLRDIPTEIILRLYRPLHSGRLVVRRSHDLSIPQVAAPVPATHADDSDSEGDALHLVVDEMVALYNAARAQGLTPDASWLTPNKNFRDL